MKKNYLVTGANGFIGSWVVRELIKKKNDTVAVISPESNARRLKQVSSKIKIARVDLRSRNKTEELIKNTRPDYVLHLATHGVYSYQQKDARKIAIGNYQIATNLLEAARKTKIKKFINTGSVFEYGTQAGKVSEKDVDISDILNKYSAVKIATTALACSYSEELQVVTLRPFTNFGPLEDEARFIHTAIKRCLNEDEIRVAPGVVRDFIYVKDVARAYIAACNTQVLSGEIINIGSGKKHILLEVAKTIKELTDSKAKIVEDASFSRPRDSRCWADIQKAKKILSWEPKYTLKEALKETIRWYKEKE